MPTSMETRKPPHALLAQMAVPSLPSRHQLPLPLLIAHAQSTRTETAAHVQILILASKVKPLHLALRMYRQVLHIKWLA